MLSNRLISTLQNRLTRVERNAKQQENMRRRETDRHGERDSERPIQQQPG